MHSPACTPAIHRPTQHLCESLGSTLSGRYLTFCPGTNLKFCLLSGIAHPAISAGVRFIFKLTLVRLLMAIGTMISINGLMMSSRGGNLVSNKRHRRMSMMVPCCLSQMAFPVGPCGAVRSTLIPHIKHQSTRAKNSLPLPTRNVDGIENLPTHRLLKSRRIGPLFLPFRK